MLPVTALKDMFPVIMTPSHDGKYFHNYTVSLLNLVIEAQKIGMSLQVVLHRGESLITRARNDCVAKFLANPQWTHLFWIDSDIGFSIEAALRLLLSDHDIAAGVYPLKRENWPAEGIPAGMTQAQFESHYTRYTVNTDGVNENNELQLDISEDGFLKLDEAPTGFMVIKRQVFERLVQSYPDYQYVPDAVGVEDKGLHYRFFDVMVDPKTRRYLSEDYGFCRLWSGLGEHVYVDCHSNLTHQGAKLYNGPFYKSLRDNLSSAIGAPKGAVMKLSGLQYVPNDES